jgi:aminocarboxymuconate-semialdehyde decarboxylase
MMPYGAIGTLFARGTVNSAALIALVEGGVFSELPSLRVVVTGHALRGVAMLAGLSTVSRVPGGAVDVLRSHVFIDTQLIQPALIRAAAELLGPNRVLAGSDWPIVDDGPIAGPLAQAMQQAGLSSVEQQAIAWANCLKVLDVRSSARADEPGAPAAGPKQVPIRH